ncbi:MAG TPA: cytochrome c oxidase subunit II [Gemmatimonadales bacterium]|jgi:cytochrome c oxidase subunit 2
MDATMTAYAADTVSSIFAPVSTPAVKEADLAWFVLVLSAVVFVVVGGLIAYSVVRFRARAGDQRPEPPQVYGSAQVEAAWTAVPLIIILVLMLVTGRVIHEIQAAPEPPTAVEVTVVGKQWWWEIRYPKLGVVTANELHVPVSDSVTRRPTFLTLESADVAHSFWVPRVAGKTDLIPNRTARMWVEPHEPGTYLGQCAEYCGAQHTLMLLRVVADPPEEFDRWVQQQRRVAAAEPADSVAAAGRRVFLGTICVSCHAVAGTTASGRYGPDLTHLMSRATIAAGAAPNTREQLRAWIRNPDDLKHGVLMPAMQIDDKYLHELVEYLLTLR